MCTQGQHHVKIRVTLPQAKELQGTRREGCHRSSRVPSERAGRWRDLDLRLPASSTEDNPFVFFQPLGVWYFMTTPAKQYKHQRPFSLSVEVTRKGSYPRQ